MQGFAKLTLAYKKTLVHFWLLQTHFYVFCWPMRICGRCDQLCFWKLSFQTSVQCIPASVQTDLGLSSPSNCSLCIHRTLHQSFICTVYLYHTYKGMHSECYIWSFTSGLWSMIEALSVAKFSLGLVLRARFLPFYAPWPIVHHW